MFSIIVAVGKNNEIGKNNQLLWHIPEDLKNFKRITTGKTVVMGRNTYDSIGKPLPNRKNIVLSKMTSILNIEMLENENTKLKVYDDFLKMVDEYKNLDEEIFIIGGEQIYKKTLEMGIADKIYMSCIDFSDETADAYFPKLDFEKWKIAKEDDYENWKFCIYEKF